MGLFISILLAVIFVLVFGWAISHGLKESKRDWDICNDIKERSLKVNSKEEIESLHKELVEQGNKIYNKYIHQELKFIDGYLRGLHKQLKQ